MIIITYFKSICDYFNYKNIYKYDYRIKIKF